MGGEPILSPHGIAVYDGLQLPAKEFGSIPNCCRGRGPSLSGIRGPTRTQGRGMQQRVGVRGSGGI